MLKDFRVKSYVQYCERDNEKLKDCANNNRHDKKLKKVSGPCQGFQTAKSERWNLNNSTVVMTYFITLNQVFVCLSNHCSKKIELLKWVVFNNRIWLWKLYNDSHGIISIVLHRVLDKFMNAYGNVFSGTETAKIISVYNLFIALFIYFSNYFFCYLV